MPREFLRTATNLLLLLFILFLHYMLFITQTRIDSHDRASSPIRTLSQDAVSSTITFDKEIENDFHRGHNDTTEVSNITVIPSPNRTFVVGKISAETVRFLNLSFFSFLTLTSPVLIKRQASKISKLWNVQMLYFASPEAWKTSWLATMFYREQLNPSDDWSVIRLSRCIAIWARKFALRKLVSK